MLSEDFNDVIKKINSYYSQKKRFFFALNYEKSRGIFLDEADILSKSKLIKFKVGNFSNAKFNGDFTNILNSELKVIKPSPIRFEHYKEKFDIVKDAIFNGNSFLANLTIKTKINIDLSLEEIFDQTQSEYALFVKDEFVCFSPECFIKIIGDKIYSYPMKGTINANLPNALQTLLNDEKELREHNTIVDLIRNDVGIVSHNVKVEEFRFAQYIQRLGQSPIIQTSSKISGDFNSSLLGDALNKMLPAGSISGAPKPKTLEVLKRAELEPRNFYCGIFGFFDGRVFDSAVAIRFIENDSGTLYFRSGGGITSMSDALSEYNEVIEKIYLPMKVAPRFVETMKVENSKILNREFHISRFQNTLDNFYPNSPLKQKFSEFDEFAKNLPKGIYKLRVVYSNKIENIEFAEYTPKKITSLKLINDNNIDYSYKSTDRSHLEHLYAKRDLHSDIIICKNDFVCDCSYANLVFKKGDEYFTPSTYLLKGTKRTKLIKDGIIKPVEIRTSQIKNYDRVILINAMLDIEDNVGTDTKNIFQ